MEPKRQLEKGCSMAMDETSSHMRANQAAPAEASGAHAEGSRSSRITPPAANDPPTVISGRAPLPTPNSSDSAYRILEGRVMPGDRMGDYELVEYVGGGGMGRVFRAIDTRLARTVALKVLPPEQATDADALQRFRNEAQSAARLDHENIARVYFVGEDRGLHYIVFEFVEGVNIRVLVEEKGPLPLAEAVSYTLQAAEALAHSDARSVVHRDIKPSNLLITPEGRVKLIDMGLARLRVLDQAATDLTASGVTLGTFDYISPEQARDPRNADIRSDIYSLGCTFFFMLTGQPPFPDGTVLQKLLQHQGDQPPDVRQLRPDLPEEIEHILRKMMAKDPRHRYANPVELVGDLLPLAEAAGLRPQGAAPVWTAPATSRWLSLQRHLPWMLPVAALVCIVAILEIFVWSPAAQHSDELPDSILANQSRPVAAATPTGDSDDPAGPNKDAPLVAGTPNAAAKNGNAPDASSSSAATAGVAQTNNVPYPSNPARAGSAAGNNTPQTTPKATSPLEALVSKMRGHEYDAPSGPDSLAMSISPDGLSVTDTIVPAAGITVADNRPLLLTHNTALPASETARNGAVKGGNRLFVRDRPTGVNDYRTLAAACAAAQDNDVILLMYDGRRREQPITLSNKRLTICPGIGYRPTIVFSPTEVDTVKNLPSMFTVTSGGALKLAEVAIELDVPRNVEVESWSLFDIRGDFTLQLETCLLTVCNAPDHLASHDPNEMIFPSNAAFFRAAPAPEAVDGSALAPLATIELTDSIARGEGVFLSVAERQPVHLAWNNGLLIASDCLLSASGGIESPKSDEMLQVDLRHVTAVIPGGLCRLTSRASAPYQATVSLTCADCIFLGKPGVPLIEQEGVAETEDVRRRVAWKGDRNYYENFDSFWTIRIVQPGVSADITPEKLNFKQWKDHWHASRENAPSTQPLTWQNPPPANRALHNRGPADYTLNDATAGVDAAGEVVGAQMDKLWRLPTGNAGPRQSRETSGVQRSSFESP